MVTTTSPRTLEGWVCGRTRRRHQNGDLDQDRGVREQGGLKGEEVAYKLDFVIRLERYRLATAKWYFYKLDNSLMMWKGQEDRG